MIRTKKEFNPTLIITSDWHLRDSNPVCRTDNFQKAQWNKIKQIYYLSYELGIPVYHAGDLFEHWKTSPYLLNKTIHYLSPFGMDYIHTIIGNHDMPQHCIDNMDKSGLQTLFECGIINKLEDQMDWGTYPKECACKNIYYGHHKEQNKRKVIFCHIMTYKGKKPWPGCSDPECQEVFDLFPEADLIVTGHNHKTFTAKKGNQLLVNPGSLTRHKADQIEHKPCVFLYDAQQHKLKRHYLDIEKDVINRDHLEIKKNKDKRINAFIEKLSNEWDLDLSFEDNLEKVFQDEKVSKRIKNIIYKWLGN